MIEETKERTNTPGYQPLRPHEYWPWEYELQSRREGWILANDSDDCTTISRIDDPAGVQPKLDFTEPRFDGDQSAQAWVIERASQGSRPHMLAVYLTGFPVSQPLNMEPPDCVLPLNSAAERPLRRNPNIIPKLHEYRFNLGDSTDGPIGLSAIIGSRSGSKTMASLVADTISSSSPRRIPA